MNQISVLVLLVSLLSWAAHAQTKADTQTQTVSRTPERTREAWAQWIDQAIQAGAARDPQWMRLGHWRNRSWLMRWRSRSVSEADGLDFFISKNGRDTPEAELRSTLEAFLRVEGRGTDLHPQCQFPARFRWAQRRLGFSPDVTEACEGRRKWKDQLGAEGVSLIFASAYLNNAASMFGHTFLKFRSRHNRDNRELLDYGVSFAAETGSDGGVPFALFGLTGGYKGRFSLQPFHQTLREYSNLEGRDLWEYKLNLSQTEIDDFIDHLFELEKTYFDYYFIDENCSYHLLAALEAAKPEMDVTSQFSYEVIPADTVRFLSRVSGLITSIQYRPSLHTQLENEIKAASSEEQVKARQLVDSRISGEATLGPHAAKDAPNASVRVFDLALDYGAILAARDSKKMEPINHELRVARSRLGTSQSEQSVSVPAPKRPEEGHDPGRVGISFGETDGVHTINAQIRMAYHDRLSRDDGYLGGTTLEAMKLVATWDSRDEKRATLSELTILDILSTQPQNRFFSPWSWRAAFGFRTPHFSRTAGPFLSGGFGKTWDLGSNRAPFWWTFFVDGEALSNPDLIRQTPLNLGSHLLTTWFLHPRFRVGLDAGARWTINGGERVSWGELQAVQSLGRNFELRALGRSSDYLGKEVREWQIGLYQHVLF